MIAVSTVGTCWELVASIIIWLAPRTSKMKQILFSDWLPERASLSAQDRPLCSRKSEILRFYWISTSSGSTWPISSHLDRPHAWSMTHIYDWPILTIMIPSTITLFLFSQDPSIENEENKVEKGVHVFQLDH